MKIKFLLFLGLNLSLLQTQCQSKEGEAKGPLEVAFLIVDGVYNTEVIAPFDVFQHTIFHDKSGMRVFTVAPTINPITTFEGLKIIPDYAITDSSIPEIDILVVASAKHSMDTDLENQQMINWVAAVGKRTQFNLSLCDGAFVLAKAGLVDGYKSTTFPSDIPKYRDMFPKLEVLEDVSFVHDGPLITSAGGVKSYEVAMYLVEILFGEQVVNKIGAGLLIDWDQDKIPHFVNNQSK